MSKHAVSTSSPAASLRKCAGVSSRATIAMGGAGDWKERRLLGGQDDFQRIIMFCFIMLFCGALVTGVIGTALYVSTTSKNGGLRITQCTVITHDIVEQRCGAEVCAGTDPKTGKPSCDIQYSNCYEPQWQVKFSQVDSEGEVVPHATVTAWVNDPTMKTKQTALVRLNNYPINSKFLCSYDVVDANHVRWGYNDPQPWMVTMLAAWSVVGIFLCAAGFGIFFVPPRDP